MALLRALPVLSAGGDLARLSYAFCIWCAVHVDQATAPVTLKYPQHTVDSTVVWRAYLMHGECWMEANGIVRREWVVRCMASGAMWLPLLPEVRRQVASFIVQLTAAGIEAAAADNCPVPADP